MTDRSPGGEYKPETQPTAHAPKATGSPVVRGVGIKIVDALIELLIRIRDNLQHK